MAILFPLNHVIGIENAEQILWCIESI